ncbi:MAG: AEC family transporter [Propionibacteriales bacterium]|nr:AEC family transporter [Propionibacteriales bacterium]
MGFAIPATQVVIMFGLIALGWLAFRLRLVGAEAAKGMTNLLLYLISPAVIIQAFQRPFDLDQLRTAGWVFLIDVGTFVISIAVSRLLFPRRLVSEDGTRSALRFGLVYTNAGFIAIPLAQALLGDDGVFYAVAYLAVFNIFVWTHGLNQFGPDNTPLMRRIGTMLGNPNIIAIGVGLVLFATSVRLPSPLYDVLGYLGGMNTPLSMIVIGVTLAEYSLRTVFTDPLVWWGAVARNVVVPLVFIGLLWMLPIDHVARLSMLISISAPVGATLVIFSVKHGRQPAFATRLLSVSTLLSVVTLPAMIYLAGLWW